MQPQEEVTLTAAVRELTGVVKGLDKLLRDEYPKRSEVERRFVSKLESQKHVTRLVIVAIITVVGCYFVSIGAYSTCFVGDLDNPQICKFVPGYKERINQNKNVQKIHKNLMDRVKRLEQKTGN